jgi:hypothetical protein
MLSYNSDSFISRRMSLGDPDSFRDLDVSVPDDLSDLTDKPRLTQEAGEDQLEGNSHPDLPTAFNLAELPAHWSGKRKENPSKTDELEPPAKRNQLEPRCIGESAAPNPGLKRAAGGPGRQRARFRTRNRRLRPVDPAEEGAVPAPGLLTPPRFLVPGIPSSGQTT